MKIHEYQARELLAQQGIPMPVAIVATTADEASSIAEYLGDCVVIKAQVLVGGR
jgi:succinyl-CoA synthetase beta subunit